MRLRVDGSCILYYYFFKESHLVVLGGKIRIRRVTADKWEADKGKEESCFCTITFACLKMPQDASALNLESLV